MLLFDGDFHNFYFQLLINLSLMMRDSELFEAVLDLKWILYFINYLDFDYVDFNFFFLVIEFSIFFVKFSNDFFLFTGWGTYLDLEALEKPLFPVVVVYETLKHRAIMPIQQSTKKKKTTKKQTKTNEKKTVLKFRFFLLNKNCILLKKCRLINSLSL